MSDFSLMAALLATSTNEDLQKARDLARAVAFDMAGEEALQGAFAARHMADTAQLVMGALVALRIQRLSPETLERGRTYPSNGSKRSTTQ